MKKIVHLNVVCNGSTGKLMLGIHEEAKKRGYESYCFFGRGQKREDRNVMKVGNRLSLLFHIFITRVFNKHLNGSYFTTKKLINRIKNINPDIIHMHNVHGYWLNIPMFFNYLKNEYKGKIVWMLHDCWAFTGHCPYFTSIGCDKWKAKCKNCPQLSVYPKTLFFDTTEKEYIFKKKLFTGLNNIKLVVPSKWLKSVVDESFLNIYECVAIENGIDFSIFKYTEDLDVLKKYNIPQDKKILLGVANVWEERKGLNIFLNMAKLLSKDETIVLVGLSKKQLKKLPANIIGVERTDNVKELVAIYSASDVFINPSLEETFSLVTVEAMGCGLPVITCDTSAIKDLITEESGIILHNMPTEKDYYEAYKNMKLYNKEEIIKHAHEYKIELFNERNIKLYEEQF